VLHPVFLVKTRLQLQFHAAEPAASAGAAGSSASAEASAARRGVSNVLPPAHRDNYAGAFNTVRRIVAEEGVLSLYRGIGPAMVLVSHGSIQFLTYEQFKTALQTRRGSLTEDAQHSGQPPQLGANDLVLASTGSKVCAILCTYPLQVIRSCMQQRVVVAGETLLHQTTLAGTVSHVWRAESFFGFYRGVWAHMLRSTPQATITLVLYEYCNRVLTLLNATRTANDPAF
jgi:hypothetical protein